MPMKVAPGKRILIVEDDTSVRFLLVKHFRRNGYVVAEADDAAQAIGQMAHGVAFDLILTDVHLPDSSGVDLARVLHQHSPASPVVFVTGDPDAGLARQALEVDGAAGYLVKPFRLFELDEVVNRVLHGIEVDAGVDEVEPAPEPFRLAVAPTNRIAHLLDSLDIDDLESDEYARMDAVAAEAAAALDSGDSYEVVEPRWPVRLLPAEKPKSSFPCPSLNLRQAAVLAVVMAIAILLAISLPGPNPVAESSSPVSAAPGR